MSNTEPEVSELGPGSLLKELRQQQDLSVADVADKLKLMEQSVRNIEADDYKDIPITFYKGYIKNYAQLLGIDPDKASESFSQFSQKHGLENPKLVTSAYKDESASRKRNIKAARLFVKLVSFLIVLGIVYSIYYLLAEKGYWNKFINSFDKSDTTQEQPLDTDENEGELIPENDPSGQLELNQTLNESIDLQTQSELAIVAETAAPATIPEQSKVQIDSEPLKISDSNADLFLSFSGNCWLQVVDATGKILVSGTKTTGHVSNVSGQPPYQLTIGKVSSVTIQYQGEEVDLSAYSNTKIAKLVLGA